MLKVFVSVASLMFAALGLNVLSAQQPTGGGQFYTVDLKIEDNGRVVGTPSFTARPGEPVIVTVPKAGGYSFSALMRPSFQRGVARADIGFELFLAQEGSWRKVGSPTISAPLGGSGSIELAPQSVGTGQGVRLTYKVTQGLAQEASIASFGLNRCTANKMALWEETMSAPVSFAVIKASATSAALQSNCCQGPCFTCCGDSACCADPHNCIGSCCTDG